MAHIIWDFELRPALSNFFEPYERARRVGHENRSPRSQNLTLDFQKILEGPKMDQKLIFDIKYVGCKISEKFSA